ncbi:MAG: hypothetical protein H7144_04585, partial [Burkholderiales bacterium]|nr:hypothetical protein [Phycisphaerae bacterium]
MTRELRANLIFVCILIVLVTPGFVILIKKRLASETGPNDLPHPVPHAVAYIQPPPVPPGLARVEPALVRGWITRLL